MNKKAFFDDLAPQWEKEHRIDSEIQKVKRLFSHLKLKKKDWVLDSGTGTGRLIPLIRQSIGSQGTIAALDFSLEMLRIAQKRHSRKNPFIIQSNAEKLPFCREIFDVIICFALFPHISNKPEAVREFYRLLKPGGWLYIAHTMSREDLNLYHSRVKGPVCRDYLPDDSEMKKMISAAGFQDVKIRNGKYLYIAQARV
ncbi:MAG: methyltransferase domain-containing protein [Candidatus Aminicenantes bacterium]|nr:methyltransferase domain-containing protein [Candidatus Aminicenantes bacterium]